MLYPTDDLRIKWTKVVLPPVFLEEELPITERASATVFKARSEICDILARKDNRLIVVVGPCSIHDTEAAREYAERLKGVTEELSRDLCIIMRVYFEKPRTTLGWKGLINDPYLDESFRINDGLRKARHLLLDLAEMGVPAGTEFLDMISPQYVANLVSWGAIGARTTESQVHRELVSGLSCPVGFKNGTSGNVQIAIEAIMSAGHSHNFLGHTKHGQSAIFVTSGNPDCHIILRGGRQTVNYDAASVEETCRQLAKAGLSENVMIDCSHANSNKDHTRQPIVCRNVAEQIAGGDRRIVGVMIESNLVAGAQKLVPGKPLIYGQSITDACIGWDETVDALRKLAAAVKARSEDVTAAVPAQHG
ncbi:phospho-2-dehydro-3-deoxyheptonate aldolase [Edaphobacter acidisoli]|uniref:Phospho-2-dehydro-3-deoxyheptonate aldolase n=1 Tax=Edaphobacter acidisoli TaxID=2040573 RepID=A0A916RGU7_9BACT|nr:phospho-2-dehydro-3-deoxyheptonate aldolase [Edaphobacter acidisoli]